MDLRSHSQKKPNIPVSALMISHSSAENRQPSCKIVALSIVLERHIVHIMTETFTFTGDFVTCPIDGQLLDGDIPGFIVSPTIGDGDIRYPNDVLCSWTITVNIASHYSYLIMDSANGTICLKEGETEQRQ